MIGISKLYCGTVEPSDALRYRRSSGALPSHLLQFSSDKKPVVVWNVGRRCNLSCVHCYSQSLNEACDGELTTAHAESFIDGLGEFKAPVLLFSGGEPLMRPDLFRLIRHAKNRGLRAVLSTNGTLISEGVAARLAESGLSYVGISLDGMRDVNDRFRGVTGAFDLALRGIRHCIKAGVKVGLRFTINKTNVGEIPGIFRLLEEENIPRVCFYHLVYSGRGSALRHEDLDAASCRSTLDTIIDLTAGLHARGLRKEVLTVANHADGVYLYLRMRREGSPRAKAVLDLLTMNGGNSSGIGIGCVSWDGSVHADQFWRHHSFGNVRERSFGEIWTDTSDDLMAGLKDRRKKLTGKCGRCVYQAICNGNVRVRAEAVSGDVWAEDPACFLTEEEITTRFD